MFCGIMFTKVCHAGARLMKTNPLVQPFLKWAGGKRQILPVIREHIPKQFKTYYEPFIGAGAVLFAIQRNVAIINDTNAELINCYQVIQNSIDELIIDLRTHSNDKIYYYNTRDLDRTEKFKQLSPVQRASRIIFLNKTCFNGLFRVNSDGQFNVPFGNYQNPKILNDIVLKAVHQYLVSNKITILNTDFEEATATAKKGDFIYMDPPYDPISDTSSFTGYDLNGFTKEDQKRLKDVYDKLVKKGCKVLLSNSATDFIRDLYKEYQSGMIIVPANRNINSVASGRGKIEELLIKSYD
jgi:DNA adenine methylase